MRARADRLDGSLPAGAGAVTLVTLGLFGLALFPSIAPTEHASEPASDRASSGDSSRDATSYSE